MVPGRADDPIVVSGHTIAAAVVGSALVVSHMTVAGTDVLGLIP